MLYQQNFIMIKAIVFDLDNTLIDFMGAKLSSCNASIDAMIDAGLKISRKSAMKILFELYGKHGIEYNRIFQKFLMQTTGKIDMKILSAGIVAYRKVQASYHKPYRGIFDVLKKLKRRGYRLAILSDAPALKAWLRLTEIGIHNYFDIVVTFSDTRKRKPHELPFKSVLKKLKLQPWEILFVGDMPQRDIKGAKSMGMRTALAMYGMRSEYKKYLKGNKPDYILNNVNDILKIVE